MIIKDRIVIISRGGWGERSVTGKEHPGGLLEAGNILWLILVVIT